jgi:drug/metabolite transporter (DMT)-like permease
VSTVLAPPAEPSEPRRADWLGWFAFGTVSVVWGSTYLGIAVAVEAFTPYGLVAVRFFVGALLALLLGRIRREAWPTRQSIPYLVLSGALLLGVANALINWAEARGAPSGVTAVLCALTPLWMGLLSSRLEPLGRTGWAGLGIGLAGVIVLVFPKGRIEVDLPAAVAILGATIVWAEATLIVRRRVSGGGILTNTAVQMATASVIGLVVAPIFGGFVHAPVTTRTWLAVAYLAVFGSCVAFTAYSYLTKAWAPGRLGTYAYLNPLVAVILGATILGEPVTSRTVIGMVVILAGVALVQLRRARG